MALQEVGRTPHFIVRYDDTIGTPALVLAQAVLATCEADLARLTVPMPSHLGFGRDPFLLHPVDVQIVNVPAGGFAGKNSGFFVGRQSWLLINTFASPGVPITDDFARFVFVAEMAEQLMGFFGWDAGKSQGEALSAVMAEELYPSIPMNRAATWTRAAHPRPDYISKIFPSDTDAMSYGCGIIFLYFLRYQLGHSFHDICSAGGATLADRYKALTNATDDPAVRVGDLLDRHFGAEGFQTVTDNPFPLLEGSARRVLLAFGKARGQSQLLPGGGIARLSPFVGCPVKDYRYSEYGVTSTLTCTATAVGFGVPSFAWSVNGYPLPFFAGTGESINAPVDEPQPGDPRQPKHGTGTLQFDYVRRSEPDGVSATITVTTHSFQGDYALDLQVSASDLAPDPPLAAHQGLTLHSRDVIYDAFYYADKSRCEASLEKEISKVNKEFEKVVDLLRGRPDPPAPGYLPGVVAAIDRMREIVAAISSDNHALGSKVAHYAASVAGLPAHVFLTPTSKTEVLAPA